MSLIQVIKSSTIQRTNMGSLIAHDNTLSFLTRCDAADSRTGVKTQISKRPNLADRAMSTCILRSGNNNSLPSTRLIAKSFTYTFDLCLCHNIVIRNHWHVISASLLLWRVHRGKSLWLSNECIYTAWSMSCVKTRQEPGCVRVIEGIFSVSYFQPVYMLHSCELSIQHTFVHVWVLESSD